MHYTKGVGSMTIQGIEIKKENQWVVCYIHDFTDELKQLIRDEINYICYGRNEVDEDDVGFYSYENTIKEFLERYQSQTEKTKKGIIGELITHLLVSQVLEKLEKISTLFNKESRGIKLGFDLNYVDIKEAEIWYGEVKSGEVTQGGSPNDKNKELLGKSKSGLNQFLSGERPNIWQSVILDAMVTFNDKKKTQVKKLLKVDKIEVTTNADTKKNALLMSVLFHDANSRICCEEVKSYLTSVVDEGLFAGVIIFSIQKSTYENIENFLLSELG